MVTLHTPPLPPTPLVCLLCACSDLISLFCIQGQSRERINTRGTSVKTAIAKSYPPPKATRTQTPTAKGSQQYPKIHLSVSSLYSHATETSRKVSQWNLPDPIMMYLPPQNNSGRLKNSHRPIHPSNFHPYNLHPSIMSDERLFCAFMDVVNNSLPLRTCASKYNVHSRNIKNFLDEYEYHQI